MKKTTKKTVLAPILVSMSMKRKIRAKANEAKLSVAEYVRRKALA
jgi:hypothetical protein